MSNENERRSMDDVMASIRRIIRSERSAEPETTKESFASDAEVVDETAEVSPEANEPFSLTEDMRVEDSEAEAPKPEHDDAASIPPTPEVAEPEVPQATSVGEVTTAEPDMPQQNAVSLDESAIEDMIRRVLREELMGEIGQNISANVTRMIETEVTRRLTGPK